MQQFAVIFVPSVIAFLVLLYNVKIQHSKDVEKWMNNIRDTLEGVFSGCEYVRLAKTDALDNKKAENLGALIGKLRKLELYLNPNKEAQNDMIGISREMREYADVGKWDEFKSAEDRLVKVSQRELKKHWDSIHDQEWALLVGVSTILYLSSLAVAFVFLTNLPQIKNDQDEIKTSGISIINSPENILTTTFSCPGDTNLVADSRKSVDSKGKCLAALDSCKESKLPRIR